MRFMLIGILAVTLALPAWAGEWRYEPVDDPSGFAKGRIRYFSGFFDNTPGAYAAFTITGTSEPRLLLTIRLPRDLDEPMSGSPAVLWAHILDAGALDYFVPLMQDDSDDVCAEGWDTAVNCTMKCALDAAGARDGDYLDCTTSGLTQPWLDFRAEFERAHLQSFLDSADEWNALYWFMSPVGDFYVDLAGFPEALCEHVDVQHAWCGDAPIASKSDPSSPNTKNTKGGNSEGNATSDMPPDEQICGYSGSFGIWDLSADEYGAYIYADTDAMALSTRNGFSTSYFSLRMEPYTYDSADIEIGFATARIHGEKIPGERESMGLQEVDVTLEMSSSVASVTEEVTGELEFATEEAIQFGVPSYWLLDQLNHGYDVDIHASFAGAERLTLTIPAEGFYSMLGTALHAAEWTQINYREGRCGMDGFGGTAAQPLPSGEGIVVCGLPDGLSREDLDHSSSLLFAVPPSQAEPLQADFDASGLDVITGSEPLWNVLPQLETATYSGIPSGIAFYDRNIRVRENPANGARLVIGDAIFVPVFQEWFGEMGSLRCEHLIETRACPHPEVHEASIACE